MATVTSHVLDSVHGRSAVGVMVSLTRISTSGDRVQLFRAATDAEGRISETVSLAADDDGQYDLEFETAQYYRDLNLLTAQDQIMQSIIVRIAMPDPDKRYHFPVMSSPHSYSLWWSA